MIEKICTGIVLHKWFYEDEHMVSLLTEGGNILRLKAKGLDSFTSKNSMSLHVFNKVEVEYFTSPNNKRYTGRLKRSRTLEEFKIEGNQDNLANIEVIRNLISQQDHNSILTFKTLEKIINLINMGQMKFQYLYALIIITIRQNGYPIVVDRCVKCGRNQNIKAFEVYEGGLICKLHEEANKYKLPASTLVKIIEINSLKNPMECRDLNFNQQEINIIKSMYKQFLENQLALNMYMLDRNTQPLKE